MISAAEKLLGMSLHRPIPLFQSVELLNAGGASSIICFGDSFTQQGFWTSVFEEKIRAMYPGRYSVINKSITGNRILYDTGKRFPLKGFFGVKALERINDDVFAFEGMSHLVLWLGHNDFLEPDTVTAPKKEFVPAEGIAAGTEKLAGMISARGICLIGINYIPIGLSINASPEKNVIRARLNEWFSGCGVFDHKFDAYSAFVSPENADYPNIAYVGKDKTHPNAEGGRVVAGVIDYSIFK